MEDGWPLVEFGNQDDDWRPQDETIGDNEADDAGYDTNKKKRARFIGDNNEEHYDRLMDILHEPVEIDPISMADIESYTIYQGYRKLICRCCEYVSDELKMFEIDSMLSTFSTLSFGHCFNGLSMNWRTLGDDALYSALASLAVGLALSKARNQLLVAGPWGNGFSFLIEIVMEYRERSFAITGLGYGILMWIQPSKTDTTVFKRVFMTNRFPSQSLPPPCAVPKERTSVVSDDQCWLTRLNMTHVRLKNSFSDAIQRFRGQGRPLNLRVFRYVCHGDRPMTRVRMTMCLEETNEGEDFHNFALREIWKTASPESFYGILSSINVSPSTLCKIIRLYLSKLSPVKRCEKETFDLIAESYRRCGQIQSPWDSNGPRCNFSKQDVLLHDGQDFADIKTQLMTSALFPVLFDGIEIQTLARVLIKTWMRGEDSKSFFHEFLNALTRFDILKGAELDYECTFKALYASLEFGYELMSPEILLLTWEAIHQTQFRTARRGVSEGIQILLQRARFPHETLPGVLHTRSNDAAKHALLTDWVALMDYGCYLRSKSVGNSIWDCIDLSLSEYFDISPQYLASALSLATMCSAVVFKQKSRSTLRLLSKDILMRLKAFLHPRARQALLRT